MLQVVCALMLGGSSKLGLAGGFPSRIHTADICPFCGLEVPKDTKAMAFKVVVETGGKKKPYRCILCAIADVKASNQDLTIIAPSERVDKTVKVTRVGGKWAVVPESTVFAYAKGSHDQCQVRYRALTSEDALEMYRETDPKSLEPAKAISLEDLVKRAQ